MTDLAKHLDDLNPAVAVRTLAMNLASRTAIESDQQAQYVSLRPSMHGAVAVYLHRRYASIAMPPDRAIAVAPLLSGAVLRKKTPATTYLVLDDGLVSQNAELVSNLAEETVAWRAIGPTSAVGVGNIKKAKKNPEFCLVHNTQLLPSGACGDCY